MKLSKLVYFSSKRNNIQSKCLISLLCFFLCLSCATQKKQPAASLTNQPTEDSDKIVMLITSYLKTAKDYAAKNKYEEAYLSIVEAFQLVYSSPEVLKLKNANYYDLDIVLKKLNKKQQHL